MCAAYRLALYRRDEIGRPSGAPKPLDPALTGRFAVTESLRKRLEPSATAGGAGGTGALGTLRQLQRLINRALDGVYDSFLAALLSGGLVRLGVGSQRRQDEVYNLRADDLTNPAAYKADPATLLETARLNHFREKLKQLWRRCQPLGLSTCSTLSTQQLCRSALGAVPSPLSAGPSPTDRPHAALRPLRSSSTAIATRSTEAVPSCHRARTGLSRTPAPRARTSGSGRSGSSCCLRRMRCILRTTMTSVKCAFCACSLRGRTFSSGRSSWVCATW